MTNQDGFCWSVTITELEKKCEFGGFVTHRYLLLSDFYKDYNLIVYWFLKRIFTHCVKDANHITH